MILICACPNGNSRAGARSLTQSRWGPVAPKGGRATCQAALCTVANLLGNKRALRSETERRGQGTKLLRPMPPPGRDPARANDLAQARICFVPPDTRPRNSHEQLLAGGAAVERKDRPPPLREHSIGFSASGKTLRRTERRACRKRATPSGRRRSPPAQQAGWRFRSRPPGG